MTVYHRSPSNHHLFARQGNNKAGSFLSSLFNPDPATSSDAAPTPADPTSSSVVNTDPATEQPTSTSAQTHQNHHDTTTSEAPAVPTTSQEPPAPSTTSTSTSQTSTTTTPTTTSTSSILLTSTMSTSSLTSTRTTAPVTLTAAAVTQTRTTAALTSATDDSAVTASPSVSAAPSSNLSTGAIVGSVAGAIAGIVIVFFFVAFILRRWRRKRNELEFNPEDFVQSPSMAQVGNSHHHDNPFDPAPPNAAFRGHSIAPSISSGPNMAGQGAYAYQDGPYTDGDYATGAGAGAAATHGQQTYAYGAYDKHANDDAINGAYSSEPQVQQAYNPEVYGSYAYSTDEHPAATTDLQHAHPYSGTQFQSHYQDNAPALVAGGPAISADRGKGKAKAMSIYEDDDAYGGI